MPENNQTSPTPPLSWEKVEKYLSEKTEGGNFMALIETEKIFAKVLEKLDFPGKNIERKIKGLKFILSDYGKLLAARKIYQKILDDVDFSLESKDTEEILAVYYKTIEEIINFQKEKQSFPSRLKIKINAYLPSEPRKFLKNLAIGLVIFFFVIFVLDSTRLGRSFVFGLAKISHFIFSWILFAVLLLIGLAIIIVGALFYLESKKKGKITKIER